MCNQTKCQIERVKVFWLPLREFTRTDESGLTLDVAREEARTQKVSLLTYYLRFEFDGLDLECQARSEVFAHPSFLSTFAKIISSPSELVKSLVSMICH